MHIELPSPPPPYAHPSPVDNDNVIGTNQCLCLPKAELNTKNSTKRQLFGVQLDSQEKKLVTFARLNFTQNSVIKVCTIRV